tara:strand:+ start:95 stop:454 length:360 start_codon:yes stop_codon:yes gene_type:complete
MAKLDGYKLFVIAISSGSYAFEGNGMFGSILSYQLILTHNRCRHYLYPNANRTRVVLDGPEQHLLPLPLHSSDSNQLLAENEPPMVLQSRRRDNVYRRSFCRYDNHRLLFCRHEHLQPA